MSVIGAWIAVSAWAADAVLLEGPLRPGRPAHVLVPTTASPPRVRAEGASVFPGPVDPRGARFVVVPSAGEVTIDVDGHRRMFAAEPPAASALVVPDRVDAAVGVTELRFAVRGASAEQLQVVASEGTATVDVGADGEVQVVVRPEDSPFPRTVAVGVRDTATDDAPAWVTLRLRARRRMPLLVEPGATLHVEISSREYGPFIADEAGRIEATFDQYPGELTANVVARDSLGNETRAEMPLAGSPGWVLTGMVSGTHLPNMRPASVFLQAIRGDGASSAALKPSCRTPDADLRVTPLGAAGWFVSLPYDPRPADVRVICSVEGAEWSRRIPVGDGVPDALQLSLFPEEIRADFPEAELRVTVEDARGDRLDPSAVSLRADRGTITGRETSGLVLDAGYRGDAAIAEGSDRVVAELWRAPGAGPVQRLGVDGELVAGGVRVLARATDGHKRPLVGVPVTLSVGGQTAERVTGPGGVAEAVLAGGAGAVSATAGPWVAEGWVAMGRPSAIQPGRADLVEERGVTVRSGAVAGLSVAVDPPLLRAAPGAVAWVSVRLEDRAGVPVVDRQVQLSASEGVISDLRSRGAGEYLAEYTPPEGGGVRDITITAESDGLRTSTALTLEPRVVRVSFGPTVGWQTNFGVVNNLALGGDLDLRVRAPWLGESAMVRVGGRAWTVSSALDDGLSLRGVVVPVTLAALVRQDAGAWGLWGGAGGAAAVHRVELWAGESLVTRGHRALFGPVALIGGGRRLLGGEAVLELRASWLTGSAGEVGYRGNLGGLGVATGWRVVY